MKCHKCGAELSEDTKFCSYCGSKIEKETSPPIQSEVKGSAETPKFNATRVSASRMHRERTPRVASNRSQTNSIAVENILKVHKKTLLISLLAVALLMLLIGILIRGASSVSVPYDAIECSGRNYSDIENSFRAAGFENIIVEKLGDLQTTETDKANTVESVLIDGNSDFIQKQKFSNNTEIVIRCHTFEKCDVKILVEFVPNLIFSKYDVNLLLDDEEIGTLTHGENADFQLAVELGEHILTFRNTGSSSVKGTVDLAVDCDTENAYKISCYKDKITVETLYIDKKTELAENETKVNLSASEYINKNYQEVSDSLKLLGFTDIKFEVLYDIVFGITDEGAVESVRISDNKDFIHGDIFSKDAPVVITYHMKESSDPNRVTESESSKVEVKPNITIENNSDFASLMQITDQTDTQTIKAFADTNEGTTIEFDGCIAFMMNHKESNGTVYNTRFDVAMVGGDYNAPRVYGPIFAFNNVSYYDMKVSGTDTVAPKMNFRIVAEIEGFNEEGGFITLKPISMVLRNEPDASNRITEPELSGAETSASSKVESQKPISYSTNDESTVKNGNTGIYSYKESGRLYDIYWIIDFDEGYVYWFTDGNGDGTCDKVKIDSGDLNSSVTITYHDGDTTWQEHLRFKLKNQSDTLIMKDYTGFEHEYYATDLNNALALKAGRKIIER